MARAARAHIHDGGLDGVALVFNLDLLSAPGVGGGTGHDVVGGLAPSRLGEGDNHVRVVESSTASAEATSVVVDGDVDVGELGAAGATTRGVGGSG